jgi:hypothetical protein
MRFGVTMSSSSSLGSIFHLCAFDDLVDAADI